MDSNEDDFTPQATKWLSSKSIQYTQSTSPFTLSGYSDVTLALAERQ